MLNEPQEIANFRRNLYLLRKKAGLTQTGLAHLAGLSHGPVSAAEHSGPPISLGVALALSRALGVTVEEMCDTPPGEPERPLSAEEVARKALDLVVMLSRNPGNKTLALEHADELRRALRT